MKTHLQNLLLLPRECHQIKETVPLVPWDIACKKGLMKYLLAGDFLSSERRVLKALLGILQLAQNPFAEIEFSCYGLAQ